MRYAIVSDIHANLQAWNAVLLDIRSSGVDKILCLGDLVGYGPQPAETLQSLYEHVDHFILGNHDAAACGKLDASYFNDGARELIEWTREQLNPESKPSPPRPLRWCRQQRPETASRPSAFCGTPTPAPRSI